MDDTKKGCVSLQLVAIIACMQVQHKEIQGVSHEYLQKKGVISSYPDISAILVSNTEDFIRDC